MTGEVLYSFHGGEIVITCALFDMGNCYKVYRRIYTEQITGECKTHMEYIAAFPSCLSALSYTRMMYSGKVYRPLTEDEQEPEPD